MNNYYYLKEYLPKRYNASAEQLADRQTCYNFKDGILSEEVSKSFLNKIEAITQGNKAAWRICFIPASTQVKTIMRYTNLMSAIQSAGYTADMFTVYNEYDREAEHITGKTNNPIEGFGFKADGIVGKNVIVIDDIITRGTTFNMVAEKLLTMGATTVTGLFLAKTINPDYNPCFDPGDYYESDDDFNPAECYEEEQTYDCYNGSYAQDVEGWSDQDIDEVFDGDPDAYWNID
nr:phosphoribosyltransferase [uncultured Prevotella sp.]